MIYQFAAAPNGETRAAPGLWISRLTLTDFRCFRRLRLAPSPDPVVLTGPNGAGKTTVLEALSFLAPGRGLRRAKLQDLVRWQAASEPAAAGVGGGWAVAAQVRAPDRVLDIGTGNEPMAGGAKPAGERRLLRLNGQAVKSQTVLADLVGVTWLTPEMDRLFTEGASTRRRFLDRLVFGIDPGHAERVSAYDRAMRQRARLLRQGAADPAWLAALEDAMARNGVATAAARREATERLCVLCRHDQGPFPGAAMEVVGTVEGWLDDRPALAAEDGLRALLAASRAVDRETGGAAEGPHRSDLAVRHAATGRPAGQCSTGEQKALLIAIVLAGAQAQTAAGRPLPVVLLDEVAAHLDGRHRGALFELVSAIGAQAWYTGTDAALFQPLARAAQFFTVESGTLAGP